jgi:RNA polymerase sigma-70 factor (family 1)
LFINLNGMHINLFNNSYIGENDQYKLVFESLYPVMCQFARKFVNDYDSAADVTQEVFIELWRQRQKFESYDQVKAFLYLSIKNKCLNIIKHQNVKAKYADEILGTENETDLFIIEEEVINNLINAVEKLPEQQKQVILLGMQGFKNEEIAEKMQISVNTVKFHKKAAYHSLRSKISDSLLALILF